MKTRRKLPERELKMEMTPMIDVTFLLLIFFMCTLQFKTLEGKLEAFLPREGVNPEEEIQQVENVHVLVKAPSDPAVARDLSYRVGPRTLSSLGAVQARLERLHAADEGRTLAIEAAGPVTYEEVVQLLDHVILAGFTDVRFVGYKD